MADERRQQIAQLLSSEDPAIRRRAAEDLAEEKGFAVIAALAAALRDENKGVRDAAVRALARIGNENVAHAVVEYLADRNITTRNLAAELLMQLKERSVSALLPTMFDADQDVRKFAVDILGFIQAKASVEHMVKLLDDPDPNVVVSAAEALGNIRHDAAVPALVALYDKREDAKPCVIESLGKIGGPGAAAFLEQRFVASLSTGIADPVIMYTFLEALGAVGSARTVNVLRSQLPSVKGKLRNILLDSLLRLAQRTGHTFDDLSALKADLLAALNDDDRAIRKTVALALTEVPGDDVTDTLIMTLGTDEDLDSQLAPWLDTRSNVFVRIVELIESGSLKLGKEVVGVLSRSSSLITYADLPKEFMDSDVNLLQRACGLLKQAWDACREETRGAIVDALFRLDGDQAIEFLDAIMNDPDPWLRIHTIELLVPLDDRRIPEFIARFLQDDDEMVREMAVSALESKGYTVGNEDNQ